MSEVIHEFKDVLVIPTSDTGVYIPNPPTELLDFLDGNWWDGLDKHGLSIDSIYKADVAVNFEQGYFEGYADDRENNWDLTFSNPVDLEQERNDLQARLKQIYDAWLNVHELDMGNHYVIHSEQWEALDNAINPKEQE